MIGADWRIRFEGTGMINQAGIGDGLPTSGFMACGAPWSACAQNMRVARIETTCGVCASQAQVVRSRVRGYSPRRSCGPFPLGFVEGGDRQPLWPAADSRLREGPVQHLKPLLSSLQKKLMVRPHRVRNGASGRAAADENAKKRSHPNPVFLVNARQQL